MGEDVHTNKGNKPRKRKTQDLGHRRPNAGENGRNAQDHGEGRSWTSQAYKPGLDGSRAGL